MEHMPGISNVEEEEGKRMGGERKGKELGGEGYNILSLVRADVFRPHPLLRGYRQLVGKLDSPVMMEPLVSCLSSPNSSTSILI